MVLPILNAQRRDYIGHSKHLYLAFSVLKDSYPKRFLTVIPDIVDIFIKHISIILPH